MDFIREDVKMGVQIQSEFDMILTDWKRVAMAREMVNEIIK